MADSLSSQVLALEEQQINLKNKYQELETILHTRDETISRLKLSLRLEKFKSYLFSQIITQNTEIKISDIYQEKEGEILINNFQGGQIPIIVHDFMKESVNYFILAKKKTGEKFRAINNQVHEEKKESVVIHEDDTSFDNELIETMFEEVIKNRIYKKFLLNIKEYRGKLLVKLNLSEYIKLIKSHISRLEAIFLKKKYDAKKTATMITVALSSLDQRLVSYGQYYNYAVETDDIQRLKNCNMDYSKYYTPFAQTEICAKNCNYSLCLLTLREIGKRILVNPFGFTNLIYLHLEKSTLEDPYSFYSLEKINTDGKRCWKMECRLDELAKFFSEQIRMYCITLFRKIYYDIFNDNIYREDYTEKAPAAQQDCEQLFINILGLSKPKSFCNILRMIVVEYSTIQPSKIDKFNFTRDDPIIKKNFLQEEDSDKNLTAIVQRLFDDIPIEIAEKIWQSRVE